MSTELLNKIIQYLISKPYKEVYALMDEIKIEINKINEEEKNAKISEESSDIKESE